MTPDSRYGNVRFKHIHLYDRNGITQKGGLTIAYEVFKSEEPVQEAEDSEFHVVFNYAKCHEDDMYHRAKGRDMAFKRLQKSLSSESIDRIKPKTNDDGSWKRYNIATKISGPMSSASIIIAIHDWFAKEVDGQYSLQDTYGNLITLTDQQIDEYREIRNIIANHMEALHIYIPEI